MQEIEIASLCSDGTDSFLRREPISPCWAKEERTDNSCRFGHILVTVVWYRLNSHVHKGWCNGTEGKTLATKPDDRFDTPDPRGLGEEPVCPRLNFHD